MVEAGRDDRGAWVHCPVCGERQEVEDRDPGWPNVLNDFVWRHLHLPA